MSEDLKSPPWSNATKVVVTVASLILIGAVLWRFQQLIGPLVIAGMIAYLLNPPVVWLDVRTPLSRGLIIGIVYLVFIGIVLGVLTVVGVTAYQETVLLVRAVPSIIENIPQEIDALLDQSFLIGPWTLDLRSLNVDFDRITEQLLTAIQPLLSRSGQFLGAAASATAGWLGWAVIVLVLSFYATKDLPRFGERIGEIAHGPGYRQDVERLLREFGRIWNAYLRGQVVLATIMAIVVSVVMLVLGVRFALVLGLLAGLMEFIPVVGPFIAVIVSVMVALFQESNWLALTPISYAGVVLGVGIVLQQIENNVLVPRIVGEALDLHPIAVLVGAIMGASVAGILGIMLSAPVLASIKMIMSYAWRKQLDLEPFPETEKSLPESAILGRTRKLIGWFRARAARNGNGDTLATEKPND